MRKEKITLMEILSTYEVSDNILQTYFREGVRLGMWVGGIMTIIVFAILRLLNAI